MKLTMVDTTWDRSLERRWNLTDAEPVLTHPLYPTVEFVPADLRIWWQLSGGRRPESCRSHAWPAKREDRDRNFAAWDADGGRYPAAMPQWVRELADVVRADLHNNKTSADTGASDFWGYGLSRRWTIEDGSPVGDRRGRPFTPVDLDIWWSFYPDRPERDHRYNVYSHSAGRSDRSTAQWGGTRLRHDPDLPEWVGDLVDAQHEELAAYAMASTAERNAA
ncbi:hypothetical protein Achl_4350 (plasmid) [Pseudarthrobacter chlorophenolicus A6]|uniref:Uncharacterized protein n=1 Tax=Pseudarthrobacter chlorophenolicus (strain ATCC 700700 / DSM 12829 / CIP 107037 / JCM 12360 / KCTC 9906 / NCIMB 13794 / A6) TaxID=452863 RepID=B8HIQ4_PSECP|nr:hypothetical protein [Pseudarthrobacter chlorophenolicus]ACL42301.1 hypothetical protein Achl_4350 [Pseudarthrobacter chlorophenolicus A6]SDQ16199.1 hypothetical protein SAMN04489738_0407 [Pseudarthrobacter chlorophenolicus]